MVDEMALTNPERAVVEVVIQELHLVGCWVDHEEIGSTRECSDRCPMCRLLRAIRELRELAQL